MNPVRWHRVAEVVCNLSIKLNLLTPNSFLDVFYGTCDNRQKTAYGAPRFAHLVKFNLHNLKKLRSNFGRAEFTRQNEKAIKIINNPASGDNIG